MLGTTVPRGEGGFQVVRNFKYFNIEKEEWEKGKTNVLFEKEEFKLHVMCLLWYNKI